MLAQAVPLADPSLWEQFGPFAICFVLLGAVIAWLLRDRVKTNIDHQATVADLTSRNNELTDKLVEASSRAVGLVEGMKPLLEANTRALDRVRNP